MASWTLAGNAAVVASLASISVNAVIVGRVARVPALVRATLSMVLVLVLTGCAVLAGQHLVGSWLRDHARNELSAARREVQTRASTRVDGSRHAGRPEEGWRSRPKCVQR